MGHRRGMSFEEIAQDRMRELKDRKKKLEEEIKEIENRERELQILWNRWQDSIM